MQSHLSHSRRDVAAYRSDPKARSPGQGERRRPRTLVIVLFVTEKYNASKCRRDCSGGRGSSRSERPAGGTDHRRHRRHRIPINFPPRFSPLFFSLFFFSPLLCCSIIFIRLIAADVVPITRWTTWRRTFHHGRATSKSNVGMTLKFNASEVHLARRARERKTTAPFYYSRRDLCDFHVIFIKSGSPAE